MGDYTDATRQRVLAQLKYPRGISVRALAAQLRLSQSTIRCILVDLKADNLAHIVGKDENRLLWYRTDNEH